MSQAVGIVALAPLAVCIRVSIRTAPYVTLVKDLQPDKDGSAIFFSQLL